MQSFACFIFGKGADYVYKNDIINNVMRRKLKPIVVYLFFLSVMVGLVLADHYNKVASEKQLKEIKTTVTQRSQKRKNDRYSLTQDDFKRENRSIILGKSTLY